MSGIVNSPQSVSVSEGSLDRTDLKSRGWTESLIQKYLIAHESRVSVNHWANFSGKSVWPRSVVTAVEKSPSFRVDFEDSIRRRKVSDLVLATFLASRT